MHTPRIAALDGFRFEVEVRPMLADGTHPKLAFICATTALARAVARRLVGAKRRHFGLFAGFEGQLRDERVFVFDLAWAPREAGRHDGWRTAYAATRQAAALAGLGVASDTSAGTSIAVAEARSAVVYIGAAAAVSERLRAGDIAVACTARRCVAPIVITDQMFSNDELAFPDPEFREEILSSEIISISELGLVAELNRSLSAVNVQPSIHSVPAGTGPASNWTNRTAEFLRRRFEIEAADNGLYGAMLASRDGGFPIAPLLMSVNGPAQSVHEEFKRHEKRFNNGAAELAIRAADVIQKRRDAASTLASP